MEIEIEDFTKKGFGLGTYKRDDNVIISVEVPHAVLGDIVEVELKKKRKGFRKGKLLSMIKPSKDRVPPLCEHVGLCGGCTWQEMDYEAQVRQKEALVQKAFQKILTQHSVELYPIIPCSHPWQYRNKVEFTFSENAAKTKFLGFMIAGASRYVFNVQHCHLVSSWFSDVLNAVRSWWEKSNLQAYNGYKNSGHLRYLTLREGKNTKEKMVILTVSGNSEYPLKQKDIDTFKLAVKKKLPNDDPSIFIRVQQAIKGKPTEFFEMHLSGKDHILEKLDIDGSLFFKISPTSFFQPNTFQAEILYQKAIEILEIDHEAIVYDLFSGTGTLGMCFSRKVKEVVGIEINTHAVLDARENISLNGISNFEMHAGDVGKVCTRLMMEKNFKRPEAVMVDPPRAGLDPFSLHQLSLLEPKKILYISCSPLTQAENIQELLEKGYSLKKLLPIDQFPHTAHVENIALLVKD